jgi:hypothetical protein
VDIASSGWGPSGSSPMFTQVLTAVATSRIAVSCHRFAWRTAASGAAPQLWWPDKDTPKAQKVTRLPLHE